MINVNMTDKAGVTLATAGKYCADNVKVTPSAEILRKDEQAKTATPTTIAQDITPDAGKALSKVTVNPITAAIVGDLDADSFAPAIVAAVEGKGVTVPDATLLDGMAALIESIEAGGGLPSGISQIEYGTYTPTENESSSSVFVFASFIPDICISQAVDKSIYTDTSGIFPSNVFIGGILHNLPYSIGDYKILNSSQYRASKGTHPSTEHMALTTNASKSVFPHSQRYLFAGYTYRWVAIKFA